MSSLVSIDVEDYYKVLHPRPVYLIVSSCDGRANVASIAWVSPVNDDPPIVAVAISKDALTSELISKCGVFTINVVDESKISDVWVAGTVSGREIDKVGKLGLKLIKSRTIDAPYIDGCLAYLGCKVIRSLEINGVNLYIAKVLEVYVRKNLFDPRYGWNLYRAKILMHSSGRCFTIPGKVIIHRM